MAQDPIDEFIALPRDQQLSTLEHLSPEKQNKLLAQVKQRRSKSKPFAPRDHFSAAPSLFSVPGIKSKLYQARDWAIDQLPAAGGIAGGLIGGAAGLESGPGAIATAGLGAAAGGALGEDARQVINEHLHPDEKMSALKSGARILGQGALQGANEVTGRIGGRLASKALAPVAESMSTRYPILAKMLGFGEKTSPKAVERLTAAAATPNQSGQVLVDVGNTIGDIEREMRNLPSSERTVAGFQKAVNTRKDAMNLEAGVAMQPIRNVQTIPFGISQNIKDLVRDYMTNTQAGKSERTYLMKRAAEFEKPWTYGQLDQLRTDLASQTAKHASKTSVAKYTAEKGDIDLAIDNAILDGLRDTVYPAMDRASGKPAGYWADLKGRQSSLIRLQEVLDKRLKDLKGQQAISEVSPRFSTENISISMHPGSMPRAGAYGLRNALAPKRVLNEANRQVSKAFPNVSSLPYDVLFTTSARALEMKGPAPRREQHEQQNPTDAYASTGMSMK